MNDGPESKAEIEVRARAEGVIEQKLRDHDARIQANHDSVGTLRERSAANDAAIKVVVSEVGEMHSDVLTVVSRLDNLGRNFYVAAAAMGTMTIAVVSLIATLLVRG